jgi:hypothetical protein
MSYRFRGHRRSRPGSFLAQDRGALAITVLAKERCCRQHWNIYGDMPLRVMMVTIVAA